MARREASCLICGRMYTHTDEEAIRNFQRAYFCSLGCAADAGPIGEASHKVSGRGRAAKTPPRPKQNKGGGGS